MCIGCATRGRPIAKVRYRTLRIGRSVTALDQLCCPSSATATFRLTRIPDYSLAEIVEKPDETQSANGMYRVLYDGQCEICQACVSWLTALDHEKRTVCLAISADVLASVDSRLRMEYCLRQLHVVTPEGEIHVGWDAVANLARLFRSTTKTRPVGPVAAKVSKIEQSSEMRRQYFQLLSQRGGWLWKGRRV